tara:strand:+ start:1472 stop:2221 length:750 start_codon:yes stop_codon:yes gene_type:complete
MSQYYNGKRTRNIFKPDSEKPFKLSRSKLDLFVNCPRCFYIDRRLGVGPPPGFPFNINSAIDHLLKKEFDEYRESGEPHPLMREAGIDAVPCQHDQLDVWRENFQGVQVQHEATNLLITGAIDDLWVTPSGQHIVVDYKATSKDSPVNLDAAWQDGYKRQMEIYQWLLRGNDLEVSDTGYFVYCNGRRSEPRFNHRMEFDIAVLPYVGNDSWVDSCITEAHACLVSDEIPAVDADCDYCTYYSAVTDVL